MVKIRLLGWVVAFLLSDSQADIDKKGRKHCLLENLEKFWNFTL
jgi:hypothetical protein